MLHIFEDPSEMEVLSDKVQEAKNEYCNYFCLATDDISSKLAKSLEKLIS